MVMLYAANRTFDDHMRKRARSRSTSTYIAHHLWNGHKTDMTHIHRNRINVRTSETLILEHLHHGYKTNILQYTFLERMR